MIHETTVCSTIGACPWDALISRQVFNALGGLLLLFTSFKSKLSRIPRCHHLNHWVDQFKESLLSWLPPYWCVSNDSLIQNPINSAQLPREWCFRCPYLLGKQSLFLSSLPFSLQWSLTYRITALTGLLFDVLFAYIRACILNTRATKAWFTLRSPRGISPLAGLRIRIFHMFSFTWHNTLTIRSITGRKKLDPSLLCFPFKASLIVGACIEEKSHSREKRDAIT